MSVLEALAAGTIVLDGATGSALMERGLPVGKLPAAWSIERPEEVLRLAADYVEAGAGVILANTFGVAPAFVEASGHETEALIERSIAIAREATGDRAFVAASMSSASPDGSSGLDQSAEYARQCRRFVELGVDAIVIETMIAMDDLRQAVRAANAVRGTIPLVACMSFNEDLRTADGTLPEELAWVLEDLGADVVGVNCCDGPETVLRVVEAMARATDLPIWAKPNAGLPGKPVAEDVFVDGCRRIVSAGASAIGGCCGTTPGTIRMLANALRGT